MPANTGNRIAPGPLRSPKRKGTPQRIALSIRLEPELHDKIVRSAEVNCRSMAAETEYQLRTIFS